VSGRESGREAETSDRRSTPHQQQAESSRVRHSTGRLATLCSYRSGPRPFSRFNFHPTRLLAASLRFNPFSLQPWRKRDSGKPRSIRRMLPLSELGASKC